MAYLEIVNGKIEGWRAPSYQWDAAEFVEEIEKVCVLKTTGLHTYSTPDGNVNAVVIYYEYTDGSHFIVTSDPNNDNIIEIEVLTPYISEYDVIYHCSSYKPF